MLDIHYQQPWRRCRVWAVPNWHSCCHDKNHFKNLNVRTKVYIVKLLLWLCILSQLTFVLCILAGRGFQRKICFIFIFCRNNSAACILPLTIIIIIENWIFEIGDETWQKMFKYLSRYPVQNCVDIYCVSLIAISWYPWNIAPNKTSEVFKETQQFIIITQKLWHFEAGIPYHQLHCFINITQFNSWLVYFVKSNWAISWSVSAASSRLLTNCFPYLPE